MKTPRLFLLALLLAGAFPARTAFAQRPMAKALTVVHPTADARGFIDVWQLRADVARLEPQFASNDSTYCSSEGDGTESPAAIKRIEQAKAACERGVAKRAAAYDKVKKAFNQAWLPLIYTAVARGDKVAEVIMRQCDTTPVLDRSGIESTCDSQLRRQAVARQRLRVIGFVPAIDASDELVPLAGLVGEQLLQQLARNQALVMQRLRAGALGFDHFLVEHRNNAPQQAMERDLIWRWAVMQAVLQDAPRAFTIASLERGATREEFSTLRLNRAPQGAGRVPTWGRSLHAIDGAPFYWRSQSLAVHLPGADGPALVIAGAGIPEFERARAQLLAEMAATIDGYLAREPRWAVFLLERVGHREWVPSTMHSSSDVLDAAWEGSWIADKESQDWTPPMVARSGRAVIQRNGNTMRISVSVDGAQTPLVNVSDCALRYSLGSITAADFVNQTTIFRGKTDDDIAAQVASARTMAAQASAPLKPGQRYKQVLMQCKNAEEPDTDRVRYLLLAGEMLVEIGAENIDGKPAVRHYHRAN